MTYKEGIDDLQIRYINLLPLSIDTLQVANYVQMKVQSIQMKYYQRTGTKWMELITGYIHVLYTDNIQITYREILRIGNVYR